jgi:hypothetical protein
LERLDGFGYETRSQGNGTTHMVEASTMQHST